MLRGTKLDTVTRHIGTVTLVILIIVVMLIIADISIIAYHNLGLSPALVIQGSTIEWSNQKSAQSMKVTWTVDLLRAFSSTDYSAIIRKEGSLIGPLDDNSKTTTSFRFQFDATSVVVDRFNAVDKFNPITRTWANVGLHRLTDYSNAIMWATLAKMPGRIINKLEVWMLQEDGSLPLVPLTGIDIPSPINLLRQDASCAILRFGSVTADGFKGLVNWISDIFPAPRNGFYYIEVNTATSSETLRSIEIDCAVFSNLTKFDGRNQSTIELDSVFSGWEWVKFPAVANKEYLFIKFCYTSPVARNQRESAVLCYDLLTKKGGYYKINHGIGIPASSPTSSSIAQHPTKANKCILVTRGSNCLLSFMEIETDTSGNPVVNPVSIAVPRVTTDPEYGKYAIAQTFGSIRNGKLPLYVAWSNYIPANQIVSTGAKTLTIVRYTFDGKETVLHRDLTMFSEVEMERSSNALYQHIKLNEIDDVWTPGEKAIQINFSLSQTSHITGYDGKNKFVARPSVRLPEPTMAVTPIGLGVYNEVIPLADTKITRFMKLSDSEICIHNISPLFSVAIGRPL